MDSRRRAAETPSQGAASWLVALITLLSSPVAAQNGAELSELVFEPVRLTSATGSQPASQSTSAVDRQALLEAVAQLEATIATLRRRSSDWRLIEPLGQLAVAYQGLGRHEDALDALEEAVSLTGRGRNNNADPIPLLEQQIPSFLALGDLKKVDDTEERIYELKSEMFEPASRDMYYATINLADWLTSAYYRENFGPGTNRLRRQRGVVPKVQRCIILPGSPGGCPSDNSDLDRASMNSILSGNIKDIPDVDINDVRLRRIDRLYSGFQAAMSKAGSVQLDIVIDVAKRVARLAFATKQEMDFERDNYDYDPNYEGSREQAVRNAPQRLDESYNTGVKALEFAISVPSSVANFRPEALAALLLDLGDWHLAYGKAAAAEEAYGRAYRTLLDAGFTAENVDRAMSTELPIMIPVFATHLYTRRSIGVDPGTPLDFMGHLDVRYAVDSIGNATDIVVFGRSGSETDEIERLLEAQLKSMKFRPVLRGGKLASAGTIEARYYFAY